MLSMIDTGKDYEAHPAFWAPFVVVGEGGACLQQVTLGATHIEQF